MREIPRQEEHPIPDMGAKTSDVFAGKGESETNREVYGETAKLFADQIRQRLPVRKEPYTIADIGSFQGELMNNIIQLLPEYKFDTIAIDINEEALFKNTAVKKIVAKAEDLPFKDGSVDVAIMRYVLQWNNAEKQQEILKEIVRTIKNFALIEHVGADTFETEKWRKRLDDLFDGQEVPKMKRGEHFFSSEDEVEKWMQQSNIAFDKLKDKRIENGMDVYIERYGLDEEDAKKSREIMGDKNYFIQTDWVIYPKNK